MDVEFKKDFAYGTTVQSDGVTNIVDETKQRGVLHFSLNETYIFDEKDPDADAHLLDCILRDLDRLKEELEKLRGKRSNKEPSEEIEL